MFKQILFTVGILIIVRTDAQDDVNNPSTVPSPPSYYPLPIYATQYSISLENAPELIFGLLIQNPFNSTIQPEDVLALLQSKNLVINSKLQDIKYEHLLTITNTQVTDFLRDLTVYVPSRITANARKILQGFDIDFDDYQEYMFEVNDDAMLRLLKTGTYTDESIQNALTIMQKTEEELVQIITSKLFERLSDLPLLTILNEYEAEIEYLFYRSNITINDIMKYPSFNRAFKEFANTLNSMVITYWATAVTPNELVTTNEIASNLTLYSKYINIDLKNIENGASYRASGFVLNNSYCTIQVEEALESFVAISYSNEPNPECYYFTLDSNSEILVNRPQNVTLKNGMIFTESDGIDHVLGSPLICGNRLYGILVKQDNSTLTFVTFSGIESGIVHIPDPTAGNSRINSLHIICALLVATLSLFKFTT